MIFQIKVVNLDMADNIASYVRYTRVNYIVSFKKNNST